ncbi:MAG TPA: hypothetical protein PLP29_10225 [Candidatus Ozemobacteraceae bacterium]|nr:hypothetical protein [Candidatus Ozemobacteraceae bacterium]
MQSRRGAAARLLLAFLVLAILVPAFSVLLAGDPGLTGDENRDRERYLQRLRSMRMKRPDNPEYSYQIGNIYYSLKMEDEAIKEYRRTLRLDQHHPEAKWFLSHVLASKGYHDEAFRLTRELMDVRPDDPELYSWAGEILLKLDQNELAKEYFARVDELTFPEKTRVESIKPVIR